MKIERKLDKWLWFLIMLLPMIITLFNLLGSNGTITNGAQYLNDTLTVFGLNASNIVSNSIEAVGSYLAVSVFSKGKLLNMYMTYIIFIQLAHVIVDVVLFIVKVGRELCEKII